MACKLHIVSTVMLYIVLHGYCVFSQSQEDSYMFPVPMLSLKYRTSSPPRVYITTPSIDPVHVTVSVVGIRFETTSTVTRYQSASITLPPSVRLISTGKERKTVKVTSSGVISVHCMDNANGSEGDGFRVMPISQLGDEYYVVAYKPYTTDNPSFLCLSALDNETLVTITTKAGQTMQIVLDAYESYRFDGRSQEGELEDLSGTFVKSTRPVSVISGVYTRVPEGAEGGDGILEQMPPTKSWGYRFVLAPFLGERSGYVYRVLTNQISTLHISNRGTIQIEAGEWFEDDIIGNTVISIESEQPVLVVEYMKDWLDESGHGILYGASMIIVPALNSYINNVTFPVIECMHSNLLLYGIHVIINCTYANNLIFDDTTPMSNSEQLKTDDNEMCIFRRSVAPGVHSIGHQDPAARFTVVVYGLYADSYSYAYSAGFEPVQNPLISEDPTTTKRHLGRVLGLDLFCEGLSMTAVLNSSAIPFTLASDVHLQDPDCTASEYGDGQAMITTRYPSCHTIMEETNDYMIFRNTLILTTSDQSPIKPPQLAIECRVERRHTVETSFVSSLKRQVSFGNFTFELNTFLDNTYGKSYQPDDYPVDVKFGDNLYLAASVDATNDFELFVDSCWGTPSANPWDATSYSIIYNGCPASQSVVFSESNDTNVQQFTFKAFAFNGDSWLVFVHCQLLVCDAGTLDSRCAQGCIDTPDINPARKRRSNADLHVISSGPLVVRG